MKKLLKYWPFFLFFLLLVILFSKLFYPHLSIYVTPDFGESDILNFNYPLKDFLARSIKSFQLPVWSKDLNMGFPLMAEGQIGTFYIPNLILFFFFSTPVAFNLSYIVHLIIAFNSVFFLARKLKQSVEASFLSAFLFSFSFYIVAQFNHLNLLQAACLFPLVFYLFINLIDKPSYKNILIFSLVLSQQFFVGYVYITFITLLGCFGYLFFKIITKDLKQLLIKVLVSLTVSLIIFFLISAIQIIPTLELVNLSNRQGGLDYSIVTAYPFPPKHLLSFLNPFIFGNPKLGTYPPFAQEWGIFWENTAYIGILPLLLILISLFKLFKNRQVVFFSLLSAFSILLVLGKYSPLYFIFSFPLFNLFRVPSRYLLLTLLSISLLSGFGVDVLINKYFKKTRVLPVFYMAVILICFFDLFPKINDYNPVGDINKWLKMPKTAEILQNKSGRIINLAGGDLWNQVYLKEGWTNKEKYLYLRNDLYADSNLLYNISSFQVNTGGLKIKKNLTFSSIYNLGTFLNFDKKEASLSTAAVKILSMAHVKYIIDHFKLKSPDFIKINEVSSGNLYLDSYKIYQNLSVVPRFFTVTDYQQILTLEKLYEKLNDNRFNPHNEVFSQEKIPFKDNNKNELMSKIDLIEDKDTYVKLKITSNKPTILVASDTFYPGWHAYINNRETPIYQVNLVSRGVILNKGNSMVEFIYKPQSLITGFLISGATYIILLVILILKKLKRGFQLSRLF